MNRQGENAASAGRECLLLLFIDQEGLHGDIIDKIRDSVGKESRVHRSGCSLWVREESEIAQSCPTLCDPVDCNLPGSPSMGFSRQEYWSGLTFPSPGDLPNPGIEPGSPALQADALTSEPPGKQISGCRRKICIGKRVQENMPKVHLPISDICFLPFCAWEEG